MSLGIKSINPMQKFSHITESFACILKIFACITNNCFNYFGMCTTPKLSKYVILLFNACKAVQWAPISKYSSRFVTYALSLALLDKLSLE